MLDSLYQTLFRPREPITPLSLGAALGLMLLLSVLCGLGLAGMLDLEAFGAMGLTLSFFLLLSLGWFWLSSTTSLLAQLMGGKGTGPMTMGAIAAAFWPLLLTAPLKAAEPWLGRLSDLLGFGLYLWVILGMVRAIASAHELGWGRSALCLMGSGAAAFLGLGVLIAMPLVILALMVGLG